MNFNGTMTHVLAVLTYTQSHFLKPLIKYLVQVVSYLLLCST
jgi:hypothetical protein